MKINKRSTKARRGTFLPVILMMTSLFLAYAVLITTLSLANMRSAILQNKRITSMSIAEAGINYYMWHLSHNGVDYCDGNSPCTGAGPFGPYVHNYTDQSGNVVGTFTLTISTPSSGANSLVIKSVGKVNGVSPTRTIVSTIGMASFSKETFMLDYNAAFPNRIYLEPTDSIIGSVHVNKGGVYNRGNISGDASTTLNKTDSFCMQVLPCQVFNKGDSLFDGSDLGAPGIYQGKKIYNANEMPFPNVTAQIISSRTGLDNGTIPGNHFANPSGFLGYHIALNGTTYTLTKVKNVNAGTTITVEQSPVVYNIPDDGVIFVEADLWLNGSVNNKKVTIIASDSTGSPVSEKKITLTDSLLYANKDQYNKIGLIATGYIQTVKDPPSPNMEIDAAMISRYRRVYYNVNWWNNKVKEPGCNSATTVCSTLTVWGSTASNGGLAWIWSIGNDWKGGFQKAIVQMDPLNVNNPPPYFPTSGQFSVLSWREE